MSKREKIDKYNMYLFPVLLGLIAFLQSDLVPSGSSIDVYNQILGIHVFTMVLIILAALLLYALVPKADLIFKFISFISRKKYLSSEDKRIELTDKIDMVISFIVYYFLIVIFILFVIFGVITLGTYF